jgi:hypothetical protein
MADQTVIRSNDLVVTGNLQVSGSQVTTNSTDLTVKDRLITLNKEGTLTGTNKSGLEVESGGSIIATFGYTLDGISGWDFGGANIVNTGNISADFIGLADTPANFTGAAGQYLKVNLGETAVEFDALTSDDVTEGTNLYYTTSRFDTRLGTKTTDDLSEGSTNLYYTTGRFDTAFSGKTTTNLTEGTNLYYTDTRFDTRLAAKTTANLTEGSNLYYTTARANTDIDARIATTSVNALSDVNTSGIANGQVLMYNGTTFVAQAPALGVLNSQTSSTTSNTLTNIGTSYVSAGTIATIPSFTITTDGEVQISFTAQILQETGAGAKIGLFRANNGASMTYGSPIAEYTSMSAGFVSSFVFTDNITGSVSSVEYQVVAKFDSGTTNTYELSNISFNASEHKVDVVDNVSDLGDVTITSATAGQYLKYNGGQWVNETPVVSNNNDVSITSPTTNQILRYNGSAWINGDLSPFNIEDLGNVDTTGAANNKILKYNGTTWVVADDNYEDGIVDVVEDTTPQLGGDLDVQTHSIISTGANNIVLNPQGTGTVEILGDLTVTGTATTLEVTNVEVEDAIMLLNKHDTQPANNTNDGGVMVQRGTAEDNAAWFWDETDNRWIAATTVSNASATDIAVTANADIQAATAYLTATEAQYADLAEIYESDADYEPGTVLVIGGDKEVTQCKILQDPRVVGVVSTAPAYLMNKDANGVAVALRGKVPCKVEGPVRKGDLLVTNVTPGTATTLTDDSPTPPAFCVIGKSLETDESTGIKLINIIV